MTAEGRVEETTIPRPGPSASIGNCMAGTKAMGSGLPRRSLYFVSGMTPTISKSVEG
jgi:hypothetical protein